MFLSTFCAQLLRFVMAGNYMHLMHRDVKIQNIFVKQAHNLELAELAVGDFGAAQEGQENVSIEREQNGAHPHCRTHATYSILLIIVLLIVVLQ